MNVQDLIDELKRCDPKSPVKFGESEIDYVQEGVPPSGMKAVFLSTVRPIFPYFKSRCCGDGGTSCD